MSARSTQRGFTLLELVVVIFIIGLLIALLLPLLNRDGGPSNRVTCQGKLKQIGLALLNYEAARRRFPLVCFNARPLVDPAKNCRPGNASGGPATTGYSWIVQILPYLEESNLYKSIAMESASFTLTNGPFDPSIVNGSALTQHASCVTLPALICPAWAGDGHTNGNSTIDTGAAAPSGWGAPEYANVDANDPGAGQFKGFVAPTNYKAMVGTHMKDGVPTDNGGMRLSGQSGLTMKELSDGVSRTILACETKESGYSSWYDGTLNWLVANDPNLPAPGTNDQPPWINASSAINVGPTPQNPAVFYLPASKTANHPQNDVWWGPSSDHSKGIVMHVFADDHMIAITDKVDGATYLDLTTRNGAESIDDNLIR